MKLIEVAIILTLIFLANMAKAADRTIAFKCDWDDGDLIGSEIVQDYMTSLRWTTEVDDVKYTVVIANIKKDTSPATIIIETKKKATIKSAECDITD